MYIDERRRISDVSGAGDSARPTWLASTPSVASELVCVGKIKSNGVSQSLYIDRSEWPPKTSQYCASQHPRPHQTRAAAVVAAAAVAAASAPKVIRISPVMYPQRSHTVIRRATTSAHDYYQSQLMQKNNKDDMNERAKTGDVPVIEVVPSAMQQYHADAPVSVSRPPSKRTFDQISDPDPPHQQHLRLQLRSAAADKAARIADTADAVLAPPSSATKSAVIPASSFLVPCSAAFHGGTADGAPRHYLRPVLPRGSDAPPAACAVTNVITIVPNQSLCLQHTASSSESLSSTTSSALSPMAACCENTNILCRPISPPACANDTDRCSAAISQAAVQVEGRAIATDRHDARTQLLHRIRLIDQNAPLSAPPPVPQPPQPFRVNYIVPLSAGGAEDRPPTQQSVGTSPSSASDDSDGDEQPPPQMLEALRLVRNTPGRDVIVTSSSPANQHSASAAAAAAAAATRLVTMKLVNRRYAK